MGSDNKPVLAAPSALPPALQAMLASKYDLRAPAEGADTSIVDLAQGASAIIGTAFDPFPADVLNALPDSVKCIASIGVGVDHIDLEAAKLRGITITNTPDVTTPCLADTTMGLIIAACRGFREGLDIARTGEGRGMLTAEEWGVRVSGKTLGIIGMGNVGQAVAKRAHGFDMKLVYTTPRPSKELDETFNATSLPFDDLLKVADIVSLHCPLTDRTRHLIDAAALQKMKKSAVLINISRGPVIDELALIEALQSGQIFAAGLDVFETEPGPIRETLYQLPNVFCLPHMASATQESRIGMAMRAIANLDAFFAGNLPPDCVA